MSKVEEALAATVTAVGLAGFEVRKGLDVEELVIPGAVCACEECGPEGVRDTGIFTPTAIVEVVSPADPDENEDSGADNPALTRHLARVNSVISAIQTDDIAATLSAATTDFYCYNVEFTGKYQHVVDRKFVTALTLTLTCCASDIT